jgi:hypothetical protein
VLRVHYRARAGGHATGAYVLRLEAERGAIRTVAVFGSSTEVGYESGVKSWEVKRQYEIALHHALHGPNGGWSFSVYYGDISWRRQGPSGMSMGEGSAFECGRHGPVPAELYGQALVIVHEARNHIVAAPEAVLRSSCR